MGCRGISKKIHSLDWNLGKQITLIRSVIVAHTGLQYLYESIRGETKELGETATCGTSDFEYYIVHRWPTYWKIVWRVFHVYVRQGDVRRGRQTAGDAVPFRPTPAVRSPHRRWRSTHTTKHSAFSPWQEWLQLWKIRDKDRPVTSVENQHKTYIELSTIKQCRFDSFAFFEWWLLTCARSNWCAEKAVQKLQLFFLWKTSLTVYTCWTWDFEHTLPVCGGLWLSSACSLQ